MFNNETLGASYSDQQYRFGGRIAGTQIHNPDFAALAEAYGAWSARAATTDEFKDALVAAQGRSGLRLIHCTIDIEQLAASGASVSGLRGR